MCRGASPKPRPPLWHSRFIAARSLIGENPFVILDVVNEGDLWAIRDYTGFVEALNATEVTQFKIIHVPGLG